jgi:phospholipid/cholesterol/gamma-HCH transport system substrate-binding protein
MRNLFRDPVRVAILGTLAGILAILLATSISRLPFLDGAKTYTADLASAGGLTTGDLVKVSGVQVGKVTDLRVRGDHVQVRFTVDGDLGLGKDSTASVEVATVLGAVFLQVTSAGGGHLRTGARIPISRTTVPFTLIDTLQAAGTTVAGTDLDQLRRSLGQLDQALSGVSTDDVRATLAGLTKVSAALASRDDELSTLLAAAQKVTDTLNAKSTAIAGLLDDASSFLTVLDERRQVVVQILADTSQLGADLRTLVRQNRGELQPALADLTEVAGVLETKKRQIERSIKLLGQFTKNIDSVTGSGSWLDLFLPTSVIPDNVIVRCGPTPKPGCGR